MSNDQLTRLTASDLKALEAQIEAEISALPALETTITVSWRAKALGAIASTGAIVTLAIVEFIRSFGVWLLVIGFAWLEYERVGHGAIALGMEEASASTLALVFVLANLTHPIYVLSHVHKSELSVTRHTIRGGIEWLKSRFFAKSETRRVDSTFNPTLALSAFLLTMTTIVLALYDVLSPLITQLATGQATKPTIILITEFIMGAGMSIAGVLFLQASAHEAGLKALSFDTRSPQELLAEAHAQRNAQIADIRERVKLSYMTAKIQDEQRKKQAGNGTVQAIAPIISAIPEGDVHNPHATNGMTNGAGNHADFLAVNGNGRVPYSNGNGNVNS